MIYFIYCVCVCVCVCTEVNRHHQEFYSKFTLTMSKLLQSRTADWKHTDHICLPMADFHMCCSILHSHAKSARGHINKSQGVLLHRSSAEGSVSGL